LILWECLNLGLGSVAHWLGDREKAWLDQALTEKKGVFFQMFPYAVDSKAKGHESLQPAASVTAPATHEHEAKP